MAFGAITAVLRKAPSAVIIACTASTESAVMMCRTASSSADWKCCPSVRARGLVPACPAMRMRFLGGWQVNGILTLATGMPLEFHTAQNTSYSYGGNQHPDATGVSANLGGAQNIHEWFNPAGLRSTGERQLSVILHVRLPEFARTGRGTWTFPFSRTSALRNGLNSSSARKRSTLRTRRYLALPILRKDRRVSVTPVVARRTARATFN